MEVIKLDNRILVTVKRKTGVFKSVPIWNKTMLNLLCDPSDLIKLNKELGQIKAFINSEMNKKGYALKDVSIAIEFINKDQ